MSTSALSNCEPAAPQFNDDVDDSLDGRRGDSHPLRNGLHLEGTAKLIQFRVSESRIARQRATQHSTELGVSQSKSLNENGLAIFGLDSCVLRQAPRCTCPRSIPLLRTELRCCLWMMMSRNCRCSLLRWQS